MLLLTGATGLLGHAVVRRLVARGTPVRCLVRDPRRLGPERVRVQLAIGDLADPASWRNALRGVHAVVHLAGGARDQPRATVEELNGLAAWRLLRAAERVGAEHFVWITPLGATPHHPMRMQRAKALAAAAIAEADIADHDARPLADLRARRPPPALDRAARLPARGAAGRPRDRPHAADLGRGRGGLRARRARPRARRPRALRARRAARRSPSARSSSSSWPPSGRRRRTLPIPLAGLRAALRRRGDARRPDGPADLGRGAAAGGGDAQRDRHRGRRVARGHAAADGGGLRCAHGWAVSSCAASCSSTSSLSGLPTICTPVGQPVGRRGRSGPRSRAGR